MWGENGILGTIAGGEVLLRAFLRAAVAEGDVQAAFGIDVHVVEIKEVPATGILVIPKLKPRR